MSGINPKVFTWARETAGLSLEDAAHQVGIKAARTLSGAERLAAFERGEKEPSRALLLRMAKSYRRPLVVFYLPEPPPTGNRGEDFRRAPDAPPLDYDPRLDALLRDVRNRHDLARSLLEDEDAEPLRLVGSMRDNRSAVAISTGITVGIGFDLAEFRRCRDVRAAFAYLRDRLEQAGVFVLLLGNLGSHHTAISSTTFRGYAIADPLAPFIVINENDTAASWSFTALHEAAHLWLGQTGISGATHAGRIEQLCNDVAGRILLPREDVDRLRHLADQPFGRVLGEISQLAGSIKVSRRMVAYQLMRADIINGEMYQSLCDRFRDDWLRSRTRDPNEARDESGVSFYTVRRHRLGPALVSLAQRSLAAGALTPTRAGRLLGVNPISVHPLLNPAPA